MLITAFKSGLNTSIFSLQNSLLRNHMMTYQLFLSEYRYSDMMFVYGDNTFLRSKVHGF